jgi:hypothetical protein
MPSLGSRSSWRASVTPASSWSQLSPCSGSFPVRHPKASPSGATRRHHVCCDSSHQLGQLWLALRASVLRRAVSSRARRLRYACSAWLAPCRRRYGPPPRQTHRRGIFQLSLGNAAVHRPSASVASAARRGLTCRSTGASTACRPGREALVVHVAPRGQGAMPFRPGYLYVRPSYRGSRSDA